MGLITGFFKYKGIKKGVEVISRMLRNSDSGAKTQTRQIKPTKIKH